MPSVFMAALFLFYPLLYLRIFRYEELPHAISFFTMPTMALLCIVFLCFSADRLGAALRSSRILLFFSILFSAVSIFQFFRIENYSLENLFFSFFWLAVPLFSMAYSSGLSSALPRAMTILWFLNIAYIAGNSVLKTSIAAFGLPGNANWNAALITLTSIWALYLLSTGEWKGRSGKAYCFFLLTMITASGLWCFSRCESRAALLSLFCAGVLAVYLEYGYKHRKTCLILVLLAVTGVTLFVYTSGGSRVLVERIAEDVRIPLWEGTIDLIKDNWVSGTGPSLFESVFAPYVPEDYFMREVAAVRCNHPHNHLLFFAASFGIPLFILWVFLLGWPLLTFFMNYRKKSTISKLIFYSFIILLCHSMLDLVLYEWPTNVIGLLLLGLLWGMAFDPNGKRVKVPRILKISCAAAGAVFMLFLIVEIKGTLVSSANFRNALIFSEILKKGESATFYFDKALDAKGNSPRILYKAAMNAFYRLDNPDLALKYLERIQRDTPIKTYAHSNGFIGLILCRKSKFTEALKYLRKESETYPLSSIVWYYRFAAYTQTGDKAAAQDCYEAMLASLKIKGLSINDLPELLTNPEYDTRPQLLIKKRAGAGH